MYKEIIFQKIHEILGKKLPLYPTEEAEVLLLSERVMEANRMAKIELKVRKLI